VTGTTSDPPVFRGEGDVEQFIREFQVVATITEWPAPVRVLQLRACSTGRAKGFALGPDEAHILRALRTRFGMTSEEASDPLQVMRRDRRTLLEDHECGTTLPAPLSLPAGGAEHQDTSGDTVQKAICL